MEGFYTLHDILKQEVINGRFSVEIYSKCTEPRTLINANSLGHDAVFFQLFVKGFSGDTETAGRLTLISSGRFKGIEDGCLLHLVQGNIGRQNFP